MSLPGFTAEVAVYKSKWRYCTTGISNQMSGSREGIAPAQAAERCTRASQCHGPLPQICERCSDGHFACAHWACVDHRCEIEICGVHGRN